MSSVQSGFHLPSRNPTKVFTCQTLAYTDTTVSKDLAIPFYVTRDGVLEIRIQDNVQANLLTVGTFVGFNETGFQCKVMGGFSPVKSLGQTVIDFLKAYIDDEEGSVPSGTFELVVAPVMTKVQFSTNPSQFVDEQNAGLSDYAPSNTDYVTGSAADAYRTTWVFQSPMTVKYYSEEYSKYRYANFTSALDSV